MALKARILSKAMMKLVVPLSETENTLLVTNQLKTNIPRPGDHVSAMINPYVTPGGKSMHYASSLRVYLTAPKSKASYFLDEKGFKAGSEVKVKLKKSRFGTEGRECRFKILWGGEDVKILDEESIFSAIETTSQVTRSGAWYSITTKDGSVEKFQKKTFEDKMKDDSFRAAVMEIFDDEIIQKFDKREGDATKFYDIDGDNPSENRDELS